MKMKRHVASPWDRTNFVTFKICLRELVKLNKDRQAKGWKKWGEGGRGRALWFKTTRIHGVSTASIAHPLVRLLAPLTNLLASLYSLC